MLALPAGLLLKRPNRSVAPQGGSGCLSIDPAGLADDQGRFQHDLALDRVSILNELDQHTANHLADVVNRLMNSGQRGMGMLS